MATALTESLRITRLVESNFQRIVSADITPGNKTLIVLQGPNEAGKTSTLDGLIATLAGGKAQPDMPVRAGAEFATVELELSDAIRTRYRITRSWKGDKTWLNVSSVGEDGEASKVSSPQTLLDGLVSSLSFDPLAFAKVATGNTAAAREQAARMLFAAIDRADVPEKAKARKAAITEDRRALNAQVKQIEASIGTDPDPGQTLEPVTDEQLRSQMAAAEGSNKRRRDTVAVVDADTANAHRAAETIIGLDTQIAELHRQRTLAESRSQNALELARRHADELAAMPAEISTDQITAGLAQIREHNAKTAAQTAHRKNVAAAKELAAKAEMLTASLAAVDTRVEEILSQSDLGKAVPGLQLADGELRHNGVPFSQASGMRRLELSALIGMAANPALRIVCVDEGDQLDDASLKRLIELAKERDYHVWMTAIRAGDEYDPDTHLVDVCDGYAVSGAKTNGREVAQIQAEMATALNLDEL